MGILWDRRDVLENLWEFEAILGSVVAILGHFCDIPIIFEVTIGPF